MNTNRFQFSKLVEMNEPLWLSFERHVARKNNKAAHQRKQIQCPLKLTSQPLNAAFDNGPEVRIGPGIFAVARSEAKHG